MRCLWLFGELSAHPLTRTAMWMALLLVMLAAAYLLLRWLRAEVTDNTPPSSEVLSNFREMHAKGQLSDEEFQEIKQRLVARLHSEINEDEQSG